MKIVIGSRGSDLALWQAHFTKKKLEDLGHQVEIKIIVTKGDRIQDLSFDKIEGKGFFTKEIEEALLNHEIDLAVHSHKDLETSNPEGLVVGAVSYRENPTDLLLIRKDKIEDKGMLSLAPNAIIGTSSARRKTQLLRYSHEFEIKDLRGNVPTRIEKLRAGNYDAIVLASAGVKRLELDLSDLITVELNPREFVPAPAQGVLGFQIRDVDEALQAVLKNLNDESVANEIRIERDVLRKLNGGCQLPLGVFCEIIESEWVVTTSFAKDKNIPARVNDYYASDVEGLVDLIVADLIGDEEE
jgi:hydroxymethylbilane synthase